MVSVMYLNSSRNSPKSMETSPKSIQVTDSVDVDHIFRSLEVALSLVLQSILVYQDQVVMAKAAASIVMLATLPDAVRSLEAVVSIPPCTIL